MTVRSQQAGNQTCTLIFLLNLNCSASSLPSSKPCNLWWLHTASVHTRYEINRTLCVCFSVCRDAAVKNKTMSHLKRRGRRCITSPRAGFLCQSEKIRITEERFFDTTGHGEIMHLISISQGRPSTERQLI